MPTERTIRPMGAFFKFDTIGQSAVGYVERYNAGDGDKGPFVVMAPVMLSSGRGAQMKSYESCAIGLSTDLKMKIDERDVGKFIGVTFSDTEPTNKGSKRKVFKVEEYSRDEIKELSATADAIHRREPYKADAKTPAAQGAVAGVDDDDDLPF